MFTNALVIERAFEDGLWTSLNLRFRCAWSTDLCWCFAFVQRFFGRLGMQVALVPLNFARALPVHNPDFGAAVKTLGFHIKVIGLEFVLCVVFKFPARRAC